MKPINYFQFIIVALLLLTITLIGCNKKSSNPVSYVDGYQPDYNELQGTSYTGNFFPVAEGKQWNYTGAVDGSMNIKMSGTYYGQKMDTTITEPLDYSDCIAVSHILPPISATLSGKPYTLYPEEGYAYLGMEDTYEEIIRYYEITDSIVYIRAIPEQDEGLLEVEDPVFVKSILVVGDSWSSNPSVNTSSYIGVDDEINMEAECKLFVVGMDTVSYSIHGYPEDVQAMQLDEVAEFSGTMKSYEFGDTELKISGKILVRLYLAENIGIVATEEHIEMSFGGKISDSYGSVTIEMDFTADTDLSLSSFSGAMLKAQPSENNRNILPANLRNVIHKMNNIS